MIAAAAIAVLLVLIIKLRVHAFLALIIISALTAFATGIPTGEVVPVLLYGFGNTLASVALLVGLGAMLVAALLAVAAIVGFVSQGSKRMCGV